MSKRKFFVRRATYDDKKFQVLNLRKEKAWFDIYFVDDDGFPIPNVEFEIICSDGTTKSCTADSNGYFQDEDVPEGAIEIKVKDDSTIEPFSYLKE